MNAAGQGNFDCYIVGDGTKAATALPLIKTYANDVDDEPTAGSDKLVKSGGVFDKLYETEKEEVSLNTESGKYIGDTGNFAGGGSATDFAVKYVSCSQGEKYVLTYPNNGPSNGSARCYAIYSATDINSASKANVLARGYMTKNVVANEEIEIEVTDSNAKLLCVTQHVAGLVNLTPTLKKVIEVNRLDKLESEVGKQETHKVEVDIKDHTYIAGVYITGTGALGKSDPFGCYAIPCKKGDVFTLYTFKPLASTIARSYAIYNSEDTFTKSTALASIRLCRPS